MVLKLSWAVAPFKRLSTLLAPCSSKKYLVLTSASARGPCSASARGPQGVVRALFEEPWLRNKSCKRVGSRPMRSTKPCYTNRTKVDLYVDTLRTHLLQLEHHAGFAKLTRWIMKTRHSKYSFAPERERERESLLAQTLHNLIQIKAKALGHRKKIVKQVVSSGAPRQFHKFLSL